MGTNDLVLVVTQSFQDLWKGVVYFAPNIILAILIVIVGWFLGIVFDRIVERIIKGIKLDVGLSKAGIDTLLRKGEINLNSGLFLGGLVRWFIIIASLVAAFDVLHLSGITMFLQNIVLEYIPRVIVASLILLFSGVFGDVIAKIIRSSSKAVGNSSANFFASVAKWAIWVFAVLVSLQQLGIAVQFIGTLFVGTVGALALAFGLSFGLGGRDVAAKIIEKGYHELTKKD